MNDPEKSTVEIPGKSHPLTHTYFVARKNETGEWVVMLEESSLLEALKRYQSGVHLYGELNVKLLTEVSVRTEVAVKVRYIGEPFGMEGLLPPLEL